MQSPYKAEEITKDENGEIIKKKEEKTIIILSGQTVEPKSITETFEKPTIEVIQNEDGTSQSIIKQKKIITEVENIPLQNPRKDVDDFQLVKQIITHEYKTLSATNYKLNNKEEKNNLCEDNNDSFITELHNLFPNEKRNNDSQQNLNEQIDEIDKNESDDDKEPDPRINFEQINRVNKSRPQTSYGGLNVRRKNLQSAFKNRNSRPATSNVS